MKSYIIPVYFDPENVEELKAIKGDIHLTDCVVVKMWCYTIPSNMYEYFDKDLRYTGVNIGGIVYSSPLRRKEIEVIIDEFLKQTI